MKEIPAARGGVYGEAKMCSRRHQDDADEQLLAHVRRIATALGRSPFIKEVVGGHYIAKRFVSWPLVLALTRLELPQGMKPPKSKDFNEYNCQKNGERSGCGGTGRKRRGNEIIADFDRCAGNYGDGEWMA